MVAFYALLAAVLFGSGDFLGGRATQRTGILSVLATSHLIGLVLILVLAPLMAERFDGGDFGLGMGASGFGLLGLVLLYRGLARGPMAVVAPGPAVPCAALPGRGGASEHDVHRSEAHAGEQRLGDETRRCGHGRLGWGP